MRARSFDRAEKKPTGDVSRKPTVPSGRVGRSNASSYPRSQTVSSTAFHYTTLKMNYPTTLGVASSHNRLVQEDVREDMKLLENLGESSCLKGEMKLTRAVLIKLRERPTHPTTRMPLPFLPNSQFIPAQSSFLEY